MLDDESKKKVAALETDIDDFHVHGRELYWLCKRKQSESTFSNAVLEKTLGKPSNHSWNDNRPKDCGETLDRKK